MEQNPEVEKAFAEAEAAKKVALNYVESLKNNDFNFKHQNKPSRNIFLIMKLFYLIIQPNEQMPSDDIKKELPNMKNKCLNTAETQLKKVMLDRINNISWITPEYLNKVQMYTNPPFTDPKAMENISVGCKVVTCYFQNVLNYKRLYDIYENLKNKSQK